MEERLQAESPTKNVSVDAGSKSCATTAGQPLVAANSGGEPMAAANSGECG